MNDHSFQVTGAEADPVDIAVGARIRVARRAMGINQEHLAQACGVSFQQVQKYERGANRVSCSMLSRIAGRLEMPMSWFLGEEGADGALKISPALLKLLTSQSGQVLLDAAAALPDDRLRALSRAAIALAPEA